MKKYDVIVVGGGVAGIEAASRLARVGKKTALVEKDQLGGSAIANGALKIKYILDFFKNNKEDGIEDLLKVWDEKLLELDGLVQKKLDNENLDLYQGRGKFLSKHEFQINGQVIYGQVFILAVGTRAISPYSGDFDGKEIISHEDTVRLDNFPDQVAIVNGGIYGPELANIYSRMGADTTLIDENRSILYGEDRDHIEAVRKSLLDMGVKLIEGRRIEDVLVDQGPKILFGDGERLAYDCVVISDTKEPNRVDGMEDIGIKCSGGYINTNEAFRTNIDNIYAIGDVNGIMNMINISTEQANRVIDGLLDIKRERLSYELLPRGVFTEMEIAGVGYQERQCQILGLPYKVGKCYIEETWGGWTKVYNQGFIKVILDYEDTIIGIWAVGENVVEYIGFFSLIIEKKTKAKEILTKLIISPSIYETVKEATYRAMVSEVHLHKSMFDE